MAQETLDGLLQYLLATLNYDNRIWLSQQLVEPQSEAQASPYTLEEARERLATAQEQFRTGQFQAHEDVMQPRKRTAV